MRAEKAYKIVDCHCHVYPDKIAQKASDSISKFYNLPVRFDGRAQTIKRLAREAGITKSIIFSVATKPSQTRSINEFIASEAAECGDMFAGLGTLHPDSDDLEGDMRRLLDLGLRGVKLHPDIQGFKLDDYRCLKYTRYASGRACRFFYTPEIRALTTPTQTALNRFLRYSQT